MLCDYSVYFSAVSHRHLLTPCWFQGITRGLTLLWSVASTPEANVGVSPLSSGLCQCETLSILGLMASLAWETTLNQRFPVNMTDFSGLAALVSGWRSFADRSFIRRDFSCWVPFSLTCVSPSSAVFEHIPRLLLTYYSVMKHKMV